MTQLIQSGTMAIPEAAAGRAASTPEECDQAVADAAAVAAEWGEQSASSLVPLLNRLLDSVLAVSQEWVDVASAAKQLPADSPLAGEEWVGPLVTVRYLRLLAGALTDIAAGRRPSFAGNARPVAGGRTAVPVFPSDSFDKVALSGFSAEVWLKPDVTAGQAVDHQAAAWFGQGSPGVSLVLGAGNVSAIPITDALDRLFVSRHPVVLKMNPVNDYLGPIFDKAFGELVARGVLRIVYGGAEVGTRLVNHQDVADVHVTGSDKTFEAIVFGGGEAGAARKAELRPLVDKPVTGELGNVSPVIVVPGPWSAKDISFQSQNVASMLANNGGFNCIAVRAVVTAAGWDQRDQLLDGVRGVLRSAQGRFPYYPGARERWQRFVDAHPEAERLGDDSPGCVPWTLIPGLRPETEDEIAFTTESFNGVFGEVAIDAATTADYVRAAVEFANDRLWGTLGCTLIVHPKSLQDPQVARAVDDAIADLRYGTVAVNHWSALGFILGSTPWGAYPGHTLDDVQSGIGLVHNSQMLAEADVEKTVVRGPFRMPLKPSWFVTNRAGDVVGRRFTELSAKPRWGRVPGLVAAALRG
jgi:acyl-CoA reductase-like NAD-dependent aldehyde dehydrogenase